MFTTQAVKRVTMSIAFIAGSANRTRSMSETQAQSPMVCFFGASYLVYEKRYDSR
jgi:hypothetical protein